MFFAAVSREELDSVKGGSVGNTRLFLSPHRVSLSSRGVIFTRARVSLALLSLRKNGDYS